MDIEKKLEGSKLTVKLTGRLDTVTAPQLEAELGLDGVEEVVFEISGLDYVSSAGLRLFLSVQKTLSKRGGMTISGATEVVREVFEMTGLADIFNLV